MKNFTVLIVLLLTCMVGSLAAIQRQTGQEWFRQIQVEYNSGDSIPFLLENARHYDKARKNNAFNDILKDFEKFESFKQKDINSFDQMMDTAKKHGDKHQSIKQKTYQDLLKTSASSPHLDVSRAIRAVTNLPDLTTSQKQAKEYLNKLKISKIDPKQNPFEAQLKTILIQFELRSLLIDADLDQGRIDQETANRQHVILNLEKFQTLLDTSREHPVLAQIVQEASAGYLIKVAKARDWSYLNALGTGTLTPSNPTEESVSKIIESFHKEKQNVTPKPSWKLKKKKKKS